MIQPFDQPRQPRLQHFVLIRGTRIRSETCPIPNEQREHFCGRGIGFPVLRVHRRNELLAGRGQFIQAMYHIKFTQHKLKTDYRRTRDELKLKKN